MRRHAMVLGALLLALAAPAGAARTKPAGKPQSKPRTLSQLLSGLEYRNIGPFRGGRATTAAGVPGDAMTFYFGATGGGVWKTTDGGSHWKPISDKDFATGSIGAIAVAPSDQNVVYVGTGESPIRGNVSAGDGVYRSTDGGQTWKNIGLKDSQQISRIAIDPHDPDHAYVAAQGHAWGPNAERGVFETADGGKSWKKILYVDDKTGACDLSMDPQNPRILYAAFWQAVRRPWTLDSGGPGSSLWRSRDGGATWKKLTKGLPEETWGRVGIAASGAQEGLVYALIEARQRGGLYVSRNGGDSFEYVNGDHRIRQRAWYYTWLFPDPKSPDVVYFPNVQFFRTSDGGKTLTELHVPHGDNHALWIDPEDPARMILVNDGGATITQDGGRTWTTQDNQPTAQFYRVITDNRWPYWVYGAQQDNATAAIPSGVPEGGRIGDMDWWHDVGGGESGWIAPDPRDPNVVYASAYGGAITRYDHRTHQTREIDPWPQLVEGRAASEARYRFQWNAPVLISQHDPKVLYFAGQKLMRSTDEGQSWQEASPDLTRNDRAKQGPAGGPVSYDMTGVEVYDTIFALAESPRKAGVLWAGTDDGRIHVTTDDCKSWTEVTPKGMPEWIRVNSIEASPYDAGGAYVAATMYQFDDTRPYLYKTSDFGKSWTRIDRGIPDGAFTRVVRADPARRGLLYCGTERGMYVSFDDGGSWEPLQLNLPRVPITDLAVKNGDLVVATQGRAFWILDDLSPLRQWSPETEKSAAYFFAPRPAVRTMIEPPRHPETAPPTSGENMPGGVVFDYWLAKKPAKTDSVSLDILASGKVIRHLLAWPPEEKKPPEAEPLPKIVSEEVADEMRKADRLPESHEGLNRVVWDMRIVPPSLLPKAMFDEGIHSAPKVAPGSYTAKLTVDGKTYERDFEVRANPNLKLAAGDLAGQYDLLASLAADLSRAHATVMKIRDLRGQIHGALVRAKQAGLAGVDTPALALDAKLAEVEHELWNPEIQSNEDDLNYGPRLDHDIANLAGEVASADARPTDAEVAYDKILQSKLDAAVAKYDGLVAKDLAALNSTLSSKGVAPLMPLAKVE